MAFTGVCTKELCNVRDNISVYNNTKVNVIAFSEDSPQTLARYKEDQQLNFPLLSDFNKIVSAAYGCLCETYSLEMTGVSKRSAFVNGGNGVVRYAEVLEKASEEPDYQAIQDCWPYLIDQLQGNQSLIHKIFQIRAINLCGVTL